MVRASEHAGSDGDLWFRYLYKVIKDEETKLTTDDVEQLLKNPTLTPFQKITLQDALTEGTHTREHVLQANRKSQPKDILKLFREGNYGKEKMTDREIIEKCRCYIHCIRKRVPDDEEARFDYFKEIKKDVYENLELEKDEARVVFQAVSCDAEEFIAYFLLSQGDEPLRKYLTFEDFFEEWNSDEIFYRGYIGADLKDFEKENSELKG